MLNLKAYTGKELQNFLAMLNQCETEGVADIRFVRQRINEYINTELLKSRVKNRKEYPELRYKVKKIVKGNCPACYSGVLRPVSNDEGLKIMGCPKCRYSEIVKEI